jgi:hypothetical protein
MQRVARAINVALGCGGQPAVAGNVAPIAFSVSTTDGLTVDAQDLPAWRAAAGRNGTRRAVGVSQDKREVVHLRGAPSGPSAPLFANKLLRSTAEMASAAATRWCQRICYRRAGGRNAGILAVHCLRVTIDLTCGGCCIHGRRGEGHRINSLTGLSENFGSERRTIQEHEGR